MDNFWNWLQGCRMDFCDSFYLNFIKDDRWRYLWDGFWTTIGISFAAVLLGVLLGFTVAVIRSTHDKTGKLRLLNWLCKLYLTVIRGTPVVVQLLIIYFVIFGSVNISKILVAIVAFGVNSGAYVAEIIRGGIMSIDKGQFEAGRSLGLSYIQTMIYIILPQAFKNVLPALGNEFIVLLKETSVSGYIALQDLTKGGDIIRSQTYTAFMPLIAVALIYLAVVMLFSWLLGKLERRLKNNE
ncbi:amino acid ABC transporter permease [Victivallis vadensis]|uniref:amino acid ABC transporter permease n=2 Tax=Victivallis TaxID=172900 RepID=UPI0023F26C5A|nr:amino acid ABC transporter permease [Victivallis vadensis]